MKKIAYSVGTDPGNRKSFKLHLWRDDGKSLSKIASFQSNTHAEWLPPNGCAGGYVTTLWTAGTRNQEGYRISARIFIRTQARTPVVHLATRSNEQLAIKGLNSTDPNLRNAEARSSILLISTKKIRQLDQGNLAAFFRG